MKNVVIISSSMRKGNSDALCNEFEKGAIEANNNVRNLNLNFCLHCRDCYNFGCCTQKDDMNKIYPTLKNADVILFATPIYFGELCGQLKVFLDRCYPLYGNLKQKQIYIVATCATNSKEYLKSSLHGLKRVLKDLGQTDEPTIIYGENTDERNDVTTEQLKQAYLAGLNI